MPAYAAAFDWVRSHVESGVLPSAVLGVADRTGVVALEAFGEASVDDHYPLFSITKPLVGLTALDLVDAGRLLPTTPLSTAVPEFAALRADEVQLRHLVGHTSGIVEPPLDTPAGLRPSLLAGGRDFAAGTVARYSSIAFEGVAALIEHASGEAWQRRFARLFDRADASGLTFDRSSSRHVPVDAAEHGLDWDRFAALGHPGAGAFGRAVDLLAVGSALLRDDGTLVSPLAVEAMRRPLTAGLPKLEPYPAERGRDFGFAWNLPNAAPGLLARDTYGHGGWAGTEFWITPSVGVCSVLLANRAGLGRFGFDAEQLGNLVTAEASRG
ncbi:serine hydrolase [Agromyces sp. CFH 90414]|uniref:Serine hydrolase n=1 Tax=Agromyces agglutinans TaxID=2662258 RepID=A0A6I2F977_9MICO|nr:serine hydrolase domain-containing protein [Agromyces agglutinans]MRG61189.1 serine hydrolase [Agromyces agglutinans]